MAEPPASVPGATWSPALRLAALGMALGGAAGLVLEGPVPGGQLRLLIGAALGGMLLVQFAPGCRFADRMKMVAVACAVAVGVLLVARQAWRIWASSGAPNLWLLRVRSHISLPESLLARDLFLCAWLVLASVQLALLAPRVAAAISRSWPGRRGDWEPVVVILLVVACCTGLVSWLVSALRLVSLWGPLLAVAVVLLYTGAGVLVWSRAKSWWQERIGYCEQLARALGGTVKPWSWVTGGAVIIPTEGPVATLSRNVDPRLGGVSSGERGLPRYTRLQVPYAPTVSLQCFCTERYPGLLGAVFRPRAYGPEIKTGDAAFDTDFAVYSSQPEAARAVFASEDLRAWLRGRADRPSRHLDFGSYASLLRLDLGALAIYDPGPPPDPDQVRDMIGLLLDCLRRLQEAGFASPTPPDVVL